MPPRRPPLNPKPLLDEPSVMEVVNAHGWSPVHVSKLWQYLVQKRVSSINDIPGLPKAMYEALGEPHFTVSTSKIVTVQHSRDGHTSKLLLELQDGQNIESVIMRYGKRATVCVSSQVGCKMGCRFCATGTLGLSGNLCAGEILEQLYHANSVTPIRNVVFMGMGEPLDAYDSVINAINGMKDRRRFCLSSMHITVSTVGVIPRIRTLARDAPGVRLALSLHAPNQELRARIVPTASAWPIDKLIDAMDEYAAATPPSRNGTTVLIEYVVIGGVNDAPELSHELARLLQGRDVLINLIPYNPTDVPEAYVPPTPEAVDTFHSVLRSYGLFATVRREMGQDISGACGQLVLESKADDASDVEAKGPAPARDIEDLMSGGGCVPAGAGAGAGSSASGRVVRAAAPKRPPSPTAPPAAPSQPSTAAVVVSKPSLAETMWSLFIAAVCVVLLTYMALRHLGILARPPPLWGA